MKKYWKHGGIGALVSFMLLLIFNYFIKDSETFMYLIFTSLSLSLLFSIFSIIHSLHKTRTSELSVVFYFKEGMKVNMIYVLLTVIGLYVFFNFIDPSFLSSKIEAHMIEANKYYQENIDSDVKLQSMTQAAFLDLVKTQADSMYSTKVTLPFVSVLCLFLGTLYALFLGVYYRFLLKNF